MSEVFLIRTEDRIEGMRAIFSYFKSFFDTLSLKRVHIRPNFNTADPPPASTDISIIKELILNLKESNPSNISVGIRSGPADTEETIRTKGMYALQHEIGGFDIINFATMPVKDWVHLKPEKSHWKDGFLFAKPILDADAVITLPCLKTHQYGGHFTMSLKLSVGNLPRDGYDYMRELHSSPDQRKLIAEINQVYSTSLVILDGISAFVSGGPMEGELVKPNVMLASSDRVAIDAVGVAILRDFGTTPEVTNGPIFDQEQIKRATELGVGVKKAEDIKIITVDEASQNYAKQLQSILLA
ncbi:MAG: DUF362 domain-containing protein [Candidatus Kariarchaeaceae archaeon]|jgi:uncharacterized protein (DUF362 family)